jgi:hypothetical protein
VELKGGWVCVWELTVGDMAQILERSTRPSVDPRGGSDPAAVMLYQILLACFEGDEPGARVFADSSLPAIGALTVSEMEAVMGAINRTCGKDAQTEELLKGFTPATGAPNTSG